MNYKRELVKFIWKALDEPDLWTAEKNLLWYRYDPMVPHDKQLILWMDTGLLFFHIWKPQEIHFGIYKIPLWWKAYDVWDKKLASNPAKLVYDFLMESRFNIKNTDGS